MRPAVLILRALGLGDFVTGIPAYRGLRAGFPGHEVVLAAPAALASLARLSDAVDRLLPTGELEPISWPGPPPEVAVDLHGTGEASHRLVSATGATKLIMYETEPGPGVHEVSRWCGLLERHGIACDPTTPWLAAVPAEPALQGAVIVHPGAASGSRRWPAERFGAVIRALTATGHRVVITGNTAERSLAQEVAQSAGLATENVLAGRIDLVELAGLVCSATLVISGDTGVAHLAFAYRRPSITLYGPVSPVVWGPPPGAGPRHVALWHGTGDRPGDPHGDTPDHRLLDVTVDEVVASVHIATGG